MNIRKWMILTILSLVMISGCSSSEQQIQTKLSKQSIHKDVPSTIVEQDRHIEMHADKAAYSSEKEEATIEIKNNGTATFNFGLPFTLEKREQGTWYEIPFRSDIAFAEIGLVLAPNQTHEQKINWGDFDYVISPGEYRVIKSFYADGNERILASHFTIEEANGNK
ncbi:immunoglobulin-like domain-containing protein [Brevibacillus reuszeri]|uniref:immunoglobulin-like domain-containing protein n=1 Tax=Brevibacillus reuszeri TaxID=54915 RepID=UPI00366F47D3